MSRDIVDTLGVCERLVVAAGVECQLADQLAFEVDHADALVGDQEPELEGPLERGDLRYAVALADLPSSRERVPCTAVAGM
jgi:hypothetical protein